MNMKKCPICKNGTLCIKKKKQLRGKQDKEIDLEEFDVTCTSCGDNFLLHTLTSQNKHIIRDMFAEVNGLLTSEEVKQIRKQLNLTQKDAARLCGGGPNAFSRYERGKSSPLRSTSNLLRLLSRHPEEVEHLLSFVTHKYFDS